MLLIHFKIRNLKKYSTSQAESTNALGVAVPGAGEARAGLGDICIYIYRMENLLILIMRALNMTQLPLLLRIKGFDYV